MKKIFFTFISMLGFAIAATAQIEPTLPSLPSRTLDVTTADDKYLEDNGYVVFDAYYDIFYYDGKNVINWAKATNRRSNHVENGWGNPPAPFRAGGQDADLHFMIPNYNSTTWCSYAIRFTGATEVVVLGQCGNHTDHLYVDVYEVVAGAKASEATARTSLTENQLTTCRINNLQGNKEYVAYIYGAEDTNNRFLQIAFRSSDYKHWDWSSLPIPYADGTLWTVESSTARNNAALNDQQLTYKADADAETTIYEPTQGLYFTSNSGTASNSFQIKSNQIVLYRQNLTIRIPDCKAGQHITIRAQYADTNRYLVAKTNLTEEAAWNNSSTEWQDLVATVHSDGDVEIGTTITSNVRIQSIKVERVSSPDPCSNCFTITIR